MKISREVFLDHITVQVSRHDTMSGEQWVEMPERNYRTILAYVDQLESSELNTFIEWLQKENEVLRERIGKSELLLRKFLPIEELK